jgi:hypothetical protein
MMERKPLVTLVILLLVFALVAPIIVFKATGLTMLEMWAGVEKPFGWIESFTVTTVPNDTDTGKFGKMTKYASWLSAAADSNQIFCGLTEAAKQQLPASDFPVIFSDKLDSQARDAGEEELVVRTFAGRKWVWLGTWDDANLVDEKGVWFRAKVGDSEHVFDILVPGSLLSKEGFAGDFIKSTEDIEAVVTGSLGELKARMLGFLDKLKAGQLTEDDISAGFSVEKMPLLGNKYTIYGVFRVPVELEWYGEGVWNERGYFPGTSTPRRGDSKVWVPSMTIPVQIVVPPKLPDTWIDSLRLLKGVVAGVENFTVLGVYNGWALTSTGKCPSGIADFEQLLLGVKQMGALPGLPPSPLTKITKIDGIGVTAPEFEMSKSGTAGTYETPPPDLVEAKLFDVDVWRMKVNFDPKVDFFTPNKLLKYSIETESVGGHDNGYIVTARLNIAKGDLPFNYKHYHYIRFKVCIPIAWTMDVSFKEPNLDQTQQTWISALKKLGFDNNAIVSRLRNVVDNIANKLREWGISPPPLPTDVKDIPKYLLSVSENIRKTAKLPTVAELLGPYAGPLAKLDFTPRPAQLPTPEFKQIFIEGGENIPLDPLPLKIDLPKPIGMEVPDIVTYSNDVPTSETDTVRAEPTPTYERPYTASMYAKDAALMVIVVLGSVGAGILALRVLRKR